MQTWRTLSVSEKLVREEESERWLQRNHVQVRRTGFATVGHAAAEGSRRAKGESIHAKVLECRECE